MSKEYISSDKKDKLAKVIREAGEILQSYWPGRSEMHPDKTALGVEEKDDGSLVTRADYESNELIIAGIKQLFPEDAILSEEIPRTEDIKVAKRVWVIDPLDGTNSFVKGQDDYSILVGMVEDGIPVFGMVYFPERAFFGTAEKGLKAFVDKRQLLVSDSKTPRSQCVYLRHCEFEVGDAKYPNWMDSGLALLSVAQGTFDGMIIKLVHHKEWDLVAPSIHIEEAGGKITDENGNPITYCKKPFDYKYFVASNGHIHDYLLNSIKAG
jgi:fructose-1,6-bisphosphatase/inositol monophosphatase family enzyme